MICHVIYRLDYGGLENGLVNVINRLPPHRYRHAVITLAGYSEYSARLRDGVIVRDVAKREGQDFGMYLRLWRCFRELRPAVVHTRNLATLEAQLPALCAGVRRRVHGEHGRDVHDLDNTRARYRIMRRVFSAIVHAYIVVSRELRDYLTGEVGIASARVRRICNGVDTDRFAPRSGATAAAPADAPHIFAGRLVIGAIGRMQPVKDPMTLARAFVELVNGDAQGRARYALVMVGDGALLTEVREYLAEAGMADIVWLPGSRDDTAEILRTFDVFVLPSLAEGISNTILEAMASGVPVVATDVGGNAELVLNGDTGTLVPRADPSAMATAIARYCADSDLRQQHGAAARGRAQREFSLDRMVADYESIYDELTMKHSGPANRA